MSRQLLIQVGLICLPAFAVTVLAGMLALFSITFQPIAAGGAVGLALALLGGLLMVATAQGALHIAAMGAMASFLVRIGGAGVAALMVNGAPGATPLLATLAACLGATLVMDLLLWSRVVRRESARSATTQESARA